MTYLKIVLQGMIIAIYCFYPINTYSICHKQLTCEYLKQKEWSNAVTAARKSGHKFLYNIALTQKFLNATDDNNIKFESIIAFLQDNPYYPMRDNIIKIAEKSINNNTNPKSIVKWFRYHTPRTPYGYYHYALAAYDLINESAEMYEIAYNSWMNCDTVHIRLFLDKFANLLDDKDYYRKIQLLMIEKNIDDARSLMSISRHRKLDWQALNFMINAVNGDSNTKALFSKLSDVQRKDLAVIYSMLSHGVKKKICHEVDAVSLFALATLAEEQQVDHFITTAQLIQLRTRYARELIAKKQFDVAYSVVSDVALNSKYSGSIDAQWLAGWIALRINNDPQLAIVHFNNILSFCTGDLEDNTQVSRYKLRDYNILSKCYYWLGRAYKDQQATEIAEKYFKEAARYQYGIYGQLAIMEMQERLILTPEPQIKPNNVYLKGNDYAAAAEILLENQLPLLSKSYALFAIEYAKCHEEAYALLQKLMSYSPDVSYIAALSRRINSKFFEHIYITNASFPTPYEDKEYCVPKDILYSIVRQESLFYQYAVGHTNDYGLMQLLPATAQEVASKILNIKYESEKLLSNADYNLELGSHYFKKILDVSGSYVVAIASYNAGPYRVKGWIKDNGDPATFKEDAYKIIDWIEMIPFDGTRTYTQRVIENMHVYRSILNQRQNKPYYVSPIV